MEKLEQIQDSEAKNVYKTDDPEKLLVVYKDEATAYYGLKRGVITGKSVINNRMTNRLMVLLEQAGIPTCFLEEINDRETLVRRTTRFPMEVIVRNKAAGNLCRRLGMAEGTALPMPVLEFTYKDDELEDPLVNEYHIAAMGWADEASVKHMSEYALKINQLLLERCRQAKIDLIDLKLEFGKDAEGTVRLADEISPDTCRFWDVDTHEKLDKDRFRMDMGHV